MSRERITNEAFQNILPDQIEIEEPPTVLPGRKNLRISVTPRCNLRCPHCHNEGQPLPWLERERPDRFEASVDSIGQLIAVASLYDVKSIKFTGGEPGVHHHLVSLMTAIASYWQQEMSTVKRWGINTNGLPFMNPQRLAMLIESPFQRVTIGLDSLKEGEFSKPSSPVGVEGKRLFSDLIIPLNRAWEDQTEKEIKLNVVYTGDDERVLGVVRAGYESGIGVNVIEVNGVMGTRYETREAFLDLLNNIGGIFGLQPDYYSFLNQVYLYEKQSHDPTKPAVKFFQDHCVDLDCGHCRKIHMRVIPTVEGLAAVPCFLQTQDDVIPLTSNGIIDADKFTRSIPYLSIGPDWKKQFAQRETLW